MRNSSKVLLSPLFLASLTILLVNDFFLKDYFHNFLTGKLSDFAGVLAFALFWKALLPRQKPFIFSAIIVLFAFWKSTYSDGFIVWWNSSLPFAIERIVDYTDLSAFVVLPFAWFYGEKRQSWEIPRYVNDFALMVVALISVFAFTATSKPKPETSRYEEFSENYTIEKTPLEILKRLQEFETDEFSESKSQTRQNTSIGLNLRENFCDNRPYVTFLLSEQNGGSVIKLNSASYECQTKTDDQREKLKKLFEKEVLDFIKK